ncbi:exodeoxyribonuclease V alpha subunit [Alkalibacterium subtropicum]|uniref:ATP-dependent RecD2 DNA helicase n=1 Tax=Alkalibacterium subtropicum TaxID=753702 RepID=A0A1I1EFT2_9LACT|nr:ATP-dependent RecD-like DNA helicase [Alkalibacterium subtropicum]SFB86024.1 exodeoxyribonuclease V alpha subunit [Alkalibacterium subtropicum]
MQQLDFSNERESEDYISGEIAAIYFSSPSNYYKVMLIKIDSTNTEVDEPQTVVTGNFGQIQEGDSYKFIGKWTDHPKYGLQFQSSKYVKEKPSTEEAIITYLSSPRFRGIGKKSAQKIVDTLGLDSIDKILEDERVLDNVPGLNESKKEMILSVLEKEQGMQKVIIALNNYGISNKLAYKIYQRFEGDTLSVIQSNPYRLIEEIEGIGFSRADAVAEEIGIVSDAPERVKAGIVYTLEEQTMKSGDTYVEAEFLVKNSIEVLEKSRPFIIAPDLIADNIIELVDSQSIIQEENAFYLPSLYASEWGIANALERLRINAEKETAKVAAINKKIKEFEKRRGITFGSSQKEAIKKALTSPVFLLTGGPGTGKTTVLEVIVSIYAELEDISLDPADYPNEPFPVLLAAPTGRAAKRMKETTGLPSSTIHRLLGLTGSDDDPLQESDRMLKGTLLIIDEMSMVDTWLAYQLLKAVPDNMKVILVGDKDQLPSVGPGQVLRDLIASEEIEKKELTEIYRQNDGSSIVSLAHEIKRGDIPDDFTAKKNDRNFFPCGTNQVVDIVSLLVSKAIEKGYTAQDIQVLAPIYKGNAGIDRLNKHLQDLFNPKKEKTKEVEFMDKTYRIGDKVLQLINEPERNVFNGDMGIITGILSSKESENNSEELVIDFDGNEVNYLRNEWNKITLSYCCSIHKSQGSEYPMVILPIVFGYGRMLKKDIIYTAITRASQTLLLCGEQNAFLKSVSENTTERLTSLASRIRFNSKEENTGLEIKRKKVETSPSRTDYVLTPSAVESDAVDPMIGMKGIKP